MRPSTSKEGAHPLQPQPPSVFSGSPLPSWPALPRRHPGPTPGPPVARAEGTEVRLAPGPRVLTAEAWLSPCVLA